MANSCCMCGKELGLFSNKITLKDGYLCVKCMKAGGITSFSSSKGFRAAQVTAILEHKMEVVRNFRVTEKFDDLEIDINSQAFRLNGNIYLFENLLSYVYHEYPENSQHAFQTGESSGAAIGGAIGGLRGGVIGGALGAAVGGKIGSLFSTTCDHMYISVSLKDTFESLVRLDYITGKTRTSSSEYTTALKHAKKCLDGLQIITAHNASNRQAIEDAKKYNSKREVYIQNKHLTASQLAEELTIYKNLLYSGDITKEEYEQKKKRLLDMM